MIANSCLAICLLMFTIVGVSGHYCFFFLGGGGHCGKHGIKSWFLLGYENVKIKPGKSLESENLE